MTRCVACADDVGRAKPDPAVYRAALALLHLRPDEVIAFEDSPNGLAAAKGAGVLCVAVPNALTVRLPLDHADLRLTSLADMALEELIEAIIRADLAAWAQEPTWPWGNHIAEGGWTVSPLRILRSLGLVIDRGAWIEEGRLLGCAYPQREAAVAGLARQGVSVLINLHERAHDPARLARHGMEEVHLPVADFTPPSPPQVDRGVAAIAEALAAGRRVAVHCAGGRGRTGTLLACHLVHRGLDPDAAIARVREARPGSVETRAQAAAVEAYAQRLRSAEGRRMGTT